MPTIIAAVTEKTRTDGTWSVTVVKIVKINGTDSADILAKAEAYKTRILSAYPEARRPELVHKVLASFTEDF